MHRRHAFAIAATCAGVLVAACSSNGSTAPATLPTPATAPTTLIPQTTVALSTTTTVAELPARPGAITVHLKKGPFDIQPGQNNIDTKAGIPQPDVNGWIVGIRPNLEYADSTVPPVDVVHLHHGVWLNTAAKDRTSPLPERFFAAGEEKTAVALPAPYGYHYTTTDHWVLNYMLHNLTNEDKQVWVTYDIDIIPDAAPQAAGIISTHPVWMDVQNGSIYPVFDAVRGAGDGVTYTYPDRASNPYGGGAKKNEWTVDRDGVLVYTAGHLHPGGLRTDLFVNRGTTRAHLFESEAKYYEPAGAVSWDVAMTATLPTWHVAVHKGDVLSTTATYDSGLASWYESMGIMIVWMADSGAGDDPFTTTVDQPGLLTHGHLPENDHHGGQAGQTYKDLTQAPSEPVKGATIPIQDWIYGQGDMNLATAVPTVKPGVTITYDNLDSPIGKGQWHTITACKAPCNKSTGIAYPLADGPVIFDSGELGTGGAPTANRTTWTIPADLPAGTYTYFCRIHPLMRGAFRVEP